MGSHGGKMGSYGIPWEPPWEPPWDSMHPRVQIAALMIDEIDICLKIDYMMIHPHDERLSEYLESLTKTIKKMPQAIKSIFNVLKLC